MTRRRGHDGSKEPSSREPSSYRSAQPPASDPRSTSTPAGRIVALGDESARTDASALRAVRAHAREVQVLTNGPHLDRLFPRRHPAPRHHRRTWAQGSYAHICGRKPEPKARPVGHLDLDLVSVDRRDAASLLRVPGTDRDQVANLDVAHRLTLRRPPRPFLHVALNDQGHRRLLPKQRELRAYRLRDDRSPCSRKFVKSARRGVHDGVHTAIQALHVAPLLPLPAHRFRVAERTRAGFAVGHGIDATAAGPPPTPSSGPACFCQDRDERRRTGPTDRPRWENVVVGVAGRREPQELTQRLRVPGGWLYRSIVRGREGKEYAVSVCFVPEA